MARAIQRSKGPDDLYRAAESGNWDVIQQYEHRLEKWLSPNKDTVLHVLPRFCVSSFAVQQILARNSKLIKKKNADWETPLHIAARKGHSDIVRAIIDCIKEHREYGDVLRSKNRDGNTALHEAIINKHREIIQLLVEEDSTLVDIRNGFGRSPLYLAAENGDEGVVAFILSYDPLREAQKRFLGIYKAKKNALHATAIGNFPECLKLILRDLPHLAGETDKYGWMAIHHAARLNHHEVVREMLLSGSFVGEDKALRIAVKWGHIEVIQELLTHRPRCWSTVTKKRENIIHVAVEYEREEVLNFILRQSWASELVNGRATYKMHTPLHYYVHTKRLLGHVLVNHPAVKINALNKLGNSPLDRLRFATHLDEKRKDFLRSELEESGAKESEFIYSMEEDPETQSEENLDKLIQTYQVITTLIVTITFTAAFTVPGGYESNDGQSKGQPVLLSKTGFIAFFFFDYAALFLSLLALISLLLQPFYHYKLNREMNLVRCGQCIISSLAALFLAFITGLYSTLPKLGIRICLFIFPFLILVAVNHSTLSVRKSRLSI